MKEFKHFNAYSIDEAVSLMGNYGDRACVIAGGTDLLGKMKDAILPVYPEALVNIKTIPGLNYIKHDDNIRYIARRACPVDTVLHIRKTDPSYISCYIPYVRDLAIFYPEQDGHNTGHRI